MWVRYVIKGRHDTSMNCECEEYQCWVEKYGILIKTDPNVVMGAGKQLQIDYRVKFHLFLIYLIILE